MMLFLGIKLSCYFELNFFLFQIFYFFKDFKIWKKQKPVNFTNGKSSKGKTLQHYSLGFSFLIEFK